MWILMDSAYPKTLTLLVRVLLEHVVCYKQWDCFRGSGYDFDIVHSANRIVCRIDGLKRCSSGDSFSGLQTTSTSLANVEMTTKSDPDPSDHVKVHPYSSFALN